MNIFFLPSGLGNIRPGIHKCSFRSIVEYTRQDRKKDGFVNTPTLTWVYTRTFKEKGRRDT
jgi:hypothetical protein